MGSGCQRHGLSVCLGLNWMRTALGRPRRPRRAVEILTWPDAA